MISSPGSSLNIITDWIQIFGSATGLGFGGAILVQYLRGKLPTISEKHRLIEEIDDRDQLLADKDQYIKDFTTQFIEFQDRVNTSLQDRVIPPLTSLSQQLPVITSILEEALKRRAS